MTHQDAILAALDALTLAVAENTKARADEKLKEQYGPKPEPVTTCEQSLYSCNEEYGNIVHRCNLANKHAGAHMTEFYGFTFSWYSE